MCLEFNLHLSLLKQDLFIFINCACMYVCAPCAHLVLCKSEEGVRPPGIAVEDGC